MVDGGRGSDARDRVDIDGEEKGVKDENKKRQREVIERMWKRLNELEHQVEAGTYSGPTFADMIYDDTRTFKGVTDDEKTTVLI